MYRTANSVQTELKTDRQSQFLGASLLKFEVKKETRSKEATLQFGVYKINKEDRRSKTLKYYLIFIIAI